MIIMAFDVASVVTGYCALDIENIKFKTGNLEMKGTTEDRIRMLHHKAKKIVNSYQPSIVIIEDCYLDEHRKHTAGTKKRGNVNTLKVLAKAQGAVISATDDLMDIHYLQPSEHKQALTGIGHAGKQSTIWSIQRKLGVGNITSDEADAAALALTYLVKRKQWNILEQFRDKFEK